jgi:hypothetical protein
MADNSDGPVMQNQDVVEGGRAIRSNPALLAMLKSAPDFTAPPSDDPNVAGLATHNVLGGPVGDVVARGRPSSRVPASAIASAPAAAVPIPPIRPTDLV